MVDKYLDAIKQSTLQFPNSKICIYNIVPPVKKDTVINNPDYPFLGSDEERKQYVLYFNEKLKQKCKEFIFFDIYDKYTDSDGYLNKSFSDNHVHIIDGVFIKEFIETFRAGAQI
jgi:hypothetical protein